MELDPERPRDVQAEVRDADFRVVHGPWPNWMLQVGLVKLALWTGAIVLVLVAIAIALAAAIASRW